MWLDGLDIPLVRVIGSIFVEHYHEEQFPEGPPPGDSLSRFGNNMRPVGVMPESLKFAYFLLTTVPGKLWTNSHEPLNWIHITA